MQRRRSARALRRTVAAVALVFTIAAPAAAEVDHGVIADPISGGDLDRYARRLALSDEQRSATERLHVRYRARHQTLRAGPLAEFRRDREDFGATTTEISADVEAARRAVHDLRQLHATLRANDDRFFDELAATLAEDQLIVLLRLRADRARARHLGGPAQLSYHPALDTDLSVVYAEVAAGQPAAPDAAADAIVATYELQLAAAARAVHEFAIGYKLEQAKQLRAARATAEDGSNDFATRAHLLREGQTAFAAHACDVGDLHRRLYASLGPVLDEKLRAAFRTRFLESLYPDVPARTSVAGRELERLREARLTPALRSDVEGEWRAYHDAVDRVIERMLDTVDARRRSNASHSVKMMLDDDPYVYEDASEYDRTLRGLERRLARIDRETIDRLQMLVDEHGLTGFTLQRPATRATVDLSRGRGLHMFASTGPGGSRYGYKHVPLNRLVTRFGAGRPPLRPISKRDVAVWGARLGLDEDAAVLLDVLHEDYLAAFDALEVGGVLADLRRAREAMLTLDDDGRPALPTEDDVRRLFRAERTAVEAVRGLDAVFFDEVALALGDACPPAERVVLARARARAVFLGVEPAARHALFAFGAARERSRSSDERATVDVALLVTDLTLPPPVVAEIGPLVEGYEVAATECLERVFDRVLAFDEESALLMARHLRLDDEDGLVAEDMQAPPELDAAGLRMHDALDELRGLNRGLAATLAERLPSPHREAFATAYTRAIWPAAYRDADAVHAALDAAFGLEDLERTQREAIAEMATRYRASHATLGDRLVACGDDRACGRSVRDERDELNERTRRALRDTLTAAQAALVPGLAPAGPS